MSLNNHSIFLLNDGTVKAVGANGSGQLGIGRTSTRELQIQDVPISDVKQVVCGQEHTIFLLNDSTVKAVGRNDFGQLGIGNTSHQSTIQDVPISDVKQVACGAYHTIFLLNDSTVKAVGRNDYGQLGIGNTIHQSTPQTSLVSNVKQVACGYYHTIFLLNDGTVKAVGRNNNGQLGIGNTTNQSTIQDVPISDVKQVTCGGNHTIFLLNDGTVKAVGSNNYGQLGIGNTTNQSTIQNVPISNVKQVACGNYHTIFLLNDGTVKAVGHNYYGQLGIGRTSTYELQIQNVPISDVKQVACGSDYTIFLLNDSTVKAVGLNSNGQLGIGNTTHQSTIQDVPISDVGDLWDIIDFLLVIIKKLFFHNGFYKSYRENEWKEVAQILSESIFTAHGMGEYDTVPQEALDELEGVVEEVIWTDQPLDYIDEDNEDYLRYRILINGVEKKTWTPFQTQPLIIQEEFHYTDFNVGSNVITLEYADDLGAVGAKSFTITRINYVPRLETEIREPISVHKDNVVITGQLVDTEGDQVRYRVLLNGEELIGWTGFRVPPVDMSFIVPNSSLNIGSNRLTVELEDSFNKGKWEITINKLDIAPTLTYDFKGLTLRSTINDENGDKIRYKILINGVQRYPVGDGWTDWQDVPVEILQTFPSDYIKIKESNTLTLIVQDDFSYNEIVETINFIGDYSGLMFEDEYGNYYSTDKGEILKYLEFGTVVAGYSTDPKIVYLRNKNGFRVKNLILTKVDKIIPDNVDVELSKTRQPFVPSDTLYYPDVLAFDEYITFFVRVTAKENASPGSGEFDILAKADPI